MAHSISSCRASCRSRQGRALQIHKRGAQFAKGAFRRPGTMRVMDFCPPELPSATSGDLAVINLESSLERSWSLAYDVPSRPGIATRVFEDEQRRVQFLGDVTALDRLTDLSSELCRRNSRSPDTQVAASQIASMRHCFADAERHLAA